MDQESHVMSSDQDPRTPEQIRMDIDNARAALDRTVTELEGRLQPRHLYEEAKSAAAARMRQAGTAARDAARRGAEQAMALGYRTADRVRESPGMTLATVAGVGAAIALTVWGMNRRRASRPMRASTTPQQLPFTYGATRTRKPASMGDRSAIAGHRHPLWRRPAVLGATLAALGACGSYLTRRPRIR
jgi:ElaB/YqjD/DUF883 family membrane-anchored ribosome-binding protein